MEKMTKRLGDDHIRARKLTDGLKMISGIVLDAGTPYSNMIYFNLADHIQFDEKVVIQKMLKFGILVDWDKPRRFRLVTHYWVDDGAVEKTIKAFESVLG